MAYLERWLGSLTGLSVCATGVLTAYEEGTEAMGCT